MRSVAFSWSMIISENRYPLFGTMLWPKNLLAGAAESGSQPDRKGATSATERAEGLLRLEETRERALTRKLARQGEDYDLSQTS
jgi:hypothetical protein